MDDNNDDNEHENMDKQNEDDEKWKQLNILAEITGPLKQRTKYDLNLYFYLRIVVCLRGEYVSCFIRCVITSGII